MSAFSAGGRAGDAPMPASTGNSAGDAHAPRSMLDIRIDFLSDIARVESKNQALVPKLPMSAVRCAANERGEAASFGATTSCDETGPGARARGPVSNPGQARLAPPARA